MLRVLDQRTTSYIPDPVPVASGVCWPVYPIDCCWGVLVFLCTNPTIPVSPAGCKHDDISRELPQCSRPPQHKKFQIFCVFKIISRVAKCDRQVPYRISIIGITAGANMVATPLNHFSMQVIFFSTKSNVITHAHLSANCVASVSKAK